VSLSPADPARIEAHLRVLCEDIGCRLAGSPNEARAAEYIAAQYRALGLDTEVQEFPCICWESRQATLRAKRGRRWVEVPIQPNTQSPATPGPIEGELVYLETAHPWDLEGRDLTGKIGLLFGSAYASLERMDRLCNSGLAALLYVDKRFPTDERVASGLIAGWIDHLTLPTATVAYLPAWDLVRDGVREVRLHLDMRNFLSTSQNVVATLPGRRKLPPLVISGHHDCVATNVGAEDDGTGVAIPLELARLLAGEKPLRPIRFVSFGWEENLSEGARQYVAHPANRAETTALMINVDSVGCWMGTTRCGSRATPSYGPSCGGTWLPGASWRRSSPRSRPTPTTTPSTWRGCPRSGCTAPTAPVAAGTTTAASTPWTSWTCRAWPAPRT